MRFLAIILLFVLALPAYAADHEQAVKRTLIAFYDSHEESTLRFNLIHRFLEMPANHLGYNIRYHDINAPLPVLDDDVHGIILWFFGDMAVPDAGKYLNWLLAAATDGKKIIIMESAGISATQLKNEKAGEAYQALMNVLGIRHNMDWNALTYETSILTQDTEMVGFERKYGPTLPPFSSTYVVQGKSTSHLRVIPAKGLEPVDLVITGPQGGYVAPGYAIYVLDEGNAFYMTEKSEVVQWYINPFSFLKKALDAETAPVPDVTTLLGRRIYYSHIDGDGWNSISEIPEYAKNKIISAEVLRREILSAYSEFPFTVGLITADIDPDCYGLEQSRQVAQDIFALPNVEPSSHTHSHPLLWRFFAEYTVDKERPYLAKYPPRPASKTSLLADVESYFSKPLASDNHPRQPLGSRKLARMDQPDEEVLKYDFPTPRSYACSPFSLEEEINGSVEVVNALAPKGKRATLIQWSGNTSPYEEALAAVREAGLLNINGGDSRLDREYPSYAWVAPIGLQVGKERQIYSSNSNENTYTNLWTDRFFGFRYLQRTVANTEAPLRLSPFNLYFHVYSAQKEASLNALKDNLEYARSQALIPITASHYARIANGFYATRIIKTSPLSWRIENRGALQSFRLDDAVSLTVNIKASKGVIGYRHHQNSLYVSLDPAIEIPDIILTDNDNDADHTPYLVESRWEIKNLHIGKKSLTFEAAGYGRGSMVWQVAPNDSYNITVSRESEHLFTGMAQADSQGLLNVALGNVVALTPVQVSLTK